MFGNARCPVRIGRHQPVVRRGSADRNRSFSVFLPHSIDQGWYRCLPVNRELRDRRPYPLLAPSCPIRPRCARPPPPSKEPREELEGISLPVLRGRWAEGRGSEGVLRTAVDRRAHTYSLILYVLSPHSAHFRRTGMPQSCQLSTAWWLFSGVPGGDRIGEIRRQRVSCRE